MGKSLSIYKDDAAVAVGGLKLSNFKGRAAIVTLGCAKNQVDSEVMLGALNAAGFEIVADSERADVIIVNTCGFLEISVQESIDAILEAAKLKSSGRCRQLLVAGCMVERYRKEIRDQFPEVDSFLSVDEIRNVADIVSGKTLGLMERAGRPYFLYDDAMPRIVSTPRSYAYVKVSEGCNRPCTFCTIPSIRGSMRSREISSVVREINQLALGGAKEVNLVAQDLTSFGKDQTQNNGGDGLVKLLSAINNETEISWVRLLYAYPIGVDEGLIRSIVELPKIVEYLDIPLQHSSEQVLAAMKRPLGRFSPRNITEFIKKHGPSVAIRTTFIVGFPGETEEDVRDLEQFILEGHFTNLGVFKYSREVGTPSYDLPNQVAEEEKENRLERLMAAQRQVVGERLTAMQGKQIQVIIDGPHPESDFFLAGRARFQAPDVDGQVIINDLEGLKNEDINAGHIGQAIVSEVAGYDLVAKLIA